MPSQILLTLSQIGGNQHEIRVLLWLLWVHCMFHASLCCKKQNFLIRKTHRKTKHKQKKVVNRVYAAVCVEYNFHTYDTSQALEVMHRYDNQLPHRVYIIFISKNLYLVSIKFSI